MPLPSLRAATARGIIPCAPELVYKALSDYDAWQEWLPSLATSRLLTREGTLAIVELMLAGKGAQPLILECVGTPAKSVQARVIEGRSRLREIEWHIEAAEPGACSVAVTVRKSMGPRLLNPASWPVLPAARCVAALTAWVAAANPGPETVPGGENLFELWETEAGLVCWIRGKKYRLTPAEDGRA
jgi:ribosome-associated toxin RatA of RatAB toxin-antitoxin module